MGVLCKAAGAPHLKQAPRTAQGLAKAWRSRPQAAPSSASRSSQDTRASPSQGRCLQSAQASKPGRIRLVAHDSCGSRGQSGHMDMHNHVPKLDMHPRSSHPMRMRTSSLVRAAHSTVARAGQSPLPRSSGAALSPVLPPPPGRLAPGHLRGAGPAAWPDLRLPCPVRQQRVLRVQQRLVQVVQPDLPPRSAAVSRRAPAARQPSGRSSGVPVWDGSLHGAARNGLTSCRANRRGQRPRGACGAAGRSRAGARPRSHATTPEHPAQTLARRRRAPRTWTGGTCACSRRNRSGRRSWGCSGGCTATAAPSGSTCAAPARPARPRSASGSCCASRRPRSPAPWPLLAERRCAS